MNSVMFEEANRIVQSRSEYINVNYPLIRDAYNNEYGLNELDPLRHEICLCIMFGLCQAAITLTNHLLESLLKYALIFQHRKDTEHLHEEREGEEVTSFMKMYEDGIEKFNGAKLGVTIDTACTKRLISKDQKKVLHEMRIRFRNAYGHSDKEKTFGQDTIPVTGMKFRESEIRVGEESEPEIAKFPIGQGIIQALKAQEEAPKYYLYIDKLAREIRVKLHGPVENT
jgi:hypothetical protein